MDLRLSRPEDVSVNNPDRGDLFIGEDGQPVNIDGIDGEAQAIGVGLATYLGEWFLETSGGVPYLQQVLGVKGVTSARVQEIISREIMRRGTVTRIRRLTVDVDSARSATVDFEADTAAGEVSGVVVL